MHDATCHGMNQGADGGRQIDAVVEIPAISVDTRDVFISSGVSGLSPRGQMKESVPCALEDTFRRESPVSLLIFHFLSDDGHILGGGDHCHRAVRAAILAR